MDLTQQLDHLRKMNPDFQSIMQYAEARQAPRALALEVALVFFAEMAEAYKETILNETVRKGGEMPVIAYPAAQVAFFDDAAADPAVAIIQVHFVDNGWQVDEGPGVRPMFPERRQAFDYAMHRMRGRTGQIRLFDKENRLELTIPFDRGGR